MASLTGAAFVVSLDTLTSPTDAQTEDSDAAVKMLKYARQDPRDVLLVTQTFNCVPEKEYIEAKDNIKMMDFDERLIEKLENGESLTFKGTGNEKLVFCTEDETFEVKVGEISNSLVLCPGLLYNEDIKRTSREDRVIQKQKIRGIYHNYLELRPTFPRLGKLRKFLAPTQYAGPDNEAQVSNKGYYLSELLENIQCSRVELLNALKDISACCIEGRWRLLSLKYESEVLSLIVGATEELDSTVMRKSEVCRALGSQVPRFIVDHIMEHFAESVEGDDDGFVLKADKVCRSFAEALLTAAGGTFFLDEFVKTWTACLPPGIEADLRHLHGLALTEKGKGDSDVISLFPEYALPEDISERFRVLFKRREKWTIDEITPYIEKLTIKSMNVNAMLTKFARASTVNGARVYGARHAN